MGVSVEESRLLLFLLFFSIHAVGTTTAIGCSKERGSVMSLLLLDGRQAKNKFLLFA